jgi:hypothetical protein
MGKPFETVSFRVSITNHRAKATELMRKNRSEFSNHTYFLITFPSASYIVTSPNGVTWSFTLSQSPTITIAAR